MITTGKPFGYRMEYRPGDPIFTNPEGYEIACRAGLGGADVWGLFEEPQPDCSVEVDVYYSWCWVQPKYASAAGDLTKFKSLYRGPMLRHADTPEDVLFLFPSIVEDKMREQRPDLYSPETSPQPPGNQK